MLRFNFVCHGLMWLVEDGDWIDILIPEIEPHSYKHGRPDLGLERLSDLAPNEDWTLSGVHNSGELLSSLVSPRDALMLRGAMFDVRRELARNRYRLPKPNRIRSYRAAEVDWRIFGTTHPSTAHAQPLVSHDVTCLSYIYPPGPVTLTNGNGRSISANDPDNPVGVGWCLYAQPESVEPVPHDIRPMNRLLEFKGRGDNPDFQLSMAVQSDKAHDVAKAKGLSKTHLMNLRELNAPTSFTETDGGGGCHLGLVCCD